MSCWRSLRSPGWGAPSSHSDRTRPPRPRRRSPRGGLGQLPARRPHAGSHPADRAARRRDVPHAPRTSARLGERVHPAGLPERPADHAVRALLQRRRPDELPGGADQHEQRALRDVRPRAALLDRRGQADRRPPAAPPPRGARAGALHVPLHGRRIGGHLPSAEEGRAAAVRVPLPPDAVRPAGDPREAADARSWRSRRRRPPRRSRRPRRRRSTASPSPICTATTTRPTSRAACCSCSTRSRQ